MVVAYKHRYIFRMPTNRQRSNQWLHYLYDYEMVHEVEFLALFRMSRPTFWALLKTVNEFEQEHDDYKHLDEWKLLVLLKFLGTSGNDATGT